MRDMSSDGATDKPRPARPGRGDDRGLANIALGVLLILAVVATVVMVFTDNPVWMRIGTLAALWAAFIGAFLVARYRRQAAAEAARVRDLHTVYELQLEREISARREHELVVEKDLRDAIRYETSESVYALRQEIASLREQLAAMGVSLPEDRFAVSGGGPAGELGAGLLPSVPSERVEPRQRPSESGSRTGDTAAKPYTESASVSSSSDSSWTSTGSSSDRPASAPVSGFGSTAVSSTGRSAAAGPDTSGAQASGVGPGSTPSTERTEKFSPVTEPGTRTQEPSSSPRRPAVRPVGDSSRSSWGSAQTPTSTSASGGESAPAASQAAPAAPATPSTPTSPPAPAESTRSAESSGSHAAPAEPAAPSSPAAPQADRTEESAPASRHGSGAGMSVAELMAKLGGDDAPSGGRRRRRAED